MDMIIGWTLIGILAFYIIRAHWAGYVAFPIAGKLASTWNKAVTPKLRISVDRRNFYLWVFNPFWWSWWSCFRTGQKNVDNLKSAWKIFNKKIKSGEIQI